MFEDFVQSWGVVDKLASIGGLVFFLAFWHFIVDWGPQSHAEAMSKAVNAKVRAIHCTIYTTGMMAPLFFLVPGHVLVCSIALWISHFLIDTYIPVYVWAKYERRPPQMINPTSELEGFKSFAKEPVGLFLVIAMDQAWHILFLFPIAVLAVAPTIWSWIYGVLSIMTLALGLLVQRGGRLLAQGVSP